MTQVDVPKIDAKHRLIFAPADLLDKIGTLQQMVKDCQEDIERLATETEYLKQRDVLQQKIIDRLQDTARSHLKMLNASAAAVETLPDWGRCAPRDLFYQLVVIVCEVATEIWPNADDRPTEIEEMFRVREGYERWGPDYVH